MLPKNTYDRFLALLGVARREPSLAALTEIIRAFQFTVPFENVSKLLSLELPLKKRIPSLDAYLDNIELRQLGGTCLTNNPHLLTLLQNMGYDANLKGADMGENRCVHTVIIVAIDTFRYLVDVGYGAPFLFPIPLKNLPVEIKQGPRLYRLSGPNIGERLHMAVIEDNQEIHSYDVNPGEFSANDLGPGIDHSFKAGATFMSCLVITKHFSPNRTMTLRNLHLTERSESGITATRFESSDAAATCVRERFLMPKAPYLSAAQKLIEKCGVDPFSNSD